MAKKKGRPDCGAAISASQAQPHGKSHGHPLVPGHTLVVPRQHVGRLFDAPPRIVEAMWRMAGRVRKALEQEEHHDGYNIGVNDGACAGQTVMHAHIHVIPRTRGDVEDPRGGIRWVIPRKAVYWSP